MRKCGACGYLLFGDGETCNHCGNPVPATAVVGAVHATNEQGAPPRAAWPPAPPSPGTPVKPGPSFGAPSPNPPGPNPPGPNPNEVPEIWRPVTVTTAPAARRFPTGLVLAIVGLVAIGALGFTFVSNRNALPGGTSEFVAGNGVSFTAPDRSYTAQFPAEPQVEHAAVPIGTATAQLSLAMVQTDSYEIGSASFNLGVAVPPDRVESLLDDALNAGLSRADGDVVSKEEITRGGLPAVDAKFKAPDGYTARVLVLLKGTRIYVLFVHAKSGTDTLFEAFDKSFVPTGI